MSAKKMDKSAHEPGWGEVILGAALSVVLGAALGAVALVLRPVAHVKDMPKEPVKGVTYVLEGSHDTAKAKQAAAKRKTFIQGGSVIVTEDEINSFLKVLPVSTVAAPPKPGAKPGDKPADKPGDKPKAPEKTSKPANAAPASDEMFAIGDPNIRIREGTVQLIVPVSLNVLGLDQQVIFVGDGTFVKKGESFVFEASSAMLGSCPLQRIPFAGAMVAGKILSAKLVPEDIATAWGKLADVTVEGSSLKLTMR